MRKPRPTTTAKRPVFRDPIDWEETLPIRPSSPAWRCVIRAVYGTPLTEEEHALFLELSGGVEPPEGGALELLAVVGRRGGKSDQIARLAVYEALHGGHAIALAPGQLGLFAVVSPLREQSREILNYARGLAELPQLKRYVVGTKADAIEFTTRVVLQVTTCDVLNLSGPTLVGFCRDEWAKWPGQDAAQPDTVIEASARPALAPVTGAPPRRLIGITSAFIQEGLAYQTDRECYGAEDAPCLVVRGPTATFNPNIDRKWLARERKRCGESVYLREYEAVWQPSVVDGWFGETTITQCVSEGVSEIPPYSGVLYTVAIDQAFKSDRFAVAVAHLEARSDKPPLAVLDFVKHWRAKPGAPMSAEDRAVDIAAICQSYSSAEALCDQFAAVPLSEIFARHGIVLLEEPWTAQSKPRRFRRVRDAMVAECVSLPDYPELVREFHSIQGKLLQTGGEQIQARRGHDDLVSAAVLALSEVLDRGVPADIGLFGARGELTRSTGGSDFWGFGAEGGGSRWDSMGGKGF